MINEIESDSLSNLPIKKNKIICEYKIDEKYENIKLFDYGYDGDKNKEEFQNKFELFLDYKKIPFQNEYKFNETGIHILIIKIKENLNNIECWFYECKKLIKIDLSNFDTSQITSFRKLFSYCINLEEIYGLNNLITSNIEDVEYMFEHFEKIKFLDLSEFDTSNIFWLYVWMVLKFKRNKRIKSFQNS